MAKTPLGINVYDAARQRIAYVFDTFNRVCVSFSGGKDSTVMLHLVASEARRRRRKFALLFVDLEAQYRLTIEHVDTCRRLYADLIDLHWVAVPLSLRNAVSNFEPQWTCWDSDRVNDWVRTPPKVATTRYEFAADGMEFEDFVEQFAQWYSGGELSVFLVGIRCDESLNRFRALTGRSANFEGHKWTTYKSGSCYNAYPIYDWKTEDVWRFHANNPELPYNRLYDRMHQAGLSIHQARICQPYGDDQRKGLWLYHVIDPETWGKVVARVNGANQGALYAQESGNILGRLKITKPEGHSWESFAKLILSTMPQHTREHYERKIAVFLKWYQDRGYDRGIPDEADAKDEAAKKTPSWRRICKSLLRNDYWCKGLSFTQHKSGSYDRYTKIMNRRMREWGMT